MGKPNVTVNENVNLYSASSQKITPLMQTIWAFAAARHGGICYGLHLRNYGQ